MKNQKVLLTVGGVPGNRAKLHECAILRFVGSGYGGVYYAYPVRAGYGLTAPGTSWAANPGGETNVPFPFDGS